MTSVVPRSSVLRFALVGLLNTAIGYSVILLLHYGLELAPAPSNVLGYVVGGAVSYRLNRDFTFRSTEQHRVALPRFALTWLACIGLNLAVLSWCLTQWQWPVPVAQAVSVCTYTVAFYACNRWLVFRP